MTYAGEKATFEKVRQYGTLYVTREGGEWRLTYQARALAASPTPATAEDSAVYFTDTAAMLQHAVTMHEMASSWLALSGPVYTVIVKDNGYPVLYHAEGTTPVRYATSVATPRVTAWSQPLSELDLNE